MSIATVIMISSRLKDSSDGFVAVSVPVIEEIICKTLEGEGEGEIANRIQSKVSKTRCDRRLLNYLINC